MPIEEGEEKEEGKKFFKKSTPSSLSSPSSNDGAWLTLATFE
jgi:hypothetical protein